MESGSKYPTLYWHEYGPSVAASYNLKKSGPDRYNGPCPVCGGNDRFWIKSYNGEMKVNCNQCGDFKAIYAEMEAAGLIPRAAESNDMNVVPFNNLSDFDKVEPYHVRKNVPLGNAKLDGLDLLVPIYKIDGRKMVRVGKQTISPEGKKMFDKGMSQEAAFSPVGGTPEGVTYICEGWATAASVSVCTGRPAVFALNSGNLPKVAEQLQLTFPDVKFIVAADNDEAGIKAAKETGLPYKTPLKAGYDWNDLHQRDGDLAVKKQLSKVRMPKPLFVSLDSLEFKSPEWIIDGMLEANTFSVCFGAPAAGKTFLVLDMALCIAAGRPFHGNDVRQGSVFYIAGEGHNGFARRAAAWSKHNGVSLGGLPFFKSSRSIVLTDETSVDEMLTIIDEMVQQHGEPQLVVVDTLARAMGAADENSTKEMGAAIRAVDDIREAYDCTVLAVHHTGHGNKDRARGSSALLGAVDAEFMVEKWSAEDVIAKIEVKFTKMKDAKTPDMMNFAHKEVELVGSDLEPTQSVVLEPIEGRSKMSKEDRAAQVVKQEFEKLVETTGENSVSRSVLKANVSLEMNVSQRQADRYIKTLVDVQDLILDNNKLAAAWTC